MCVIIIVLALALAPALKESATSARNTTDWVGGQGLDCSNASISDYDKGACVITDVTPAYFFWGLLAIAGILIIAKIIIEAGATV